MEEEKPDMVFIQETKCSIDKIREMHSKWLIKYEYLEVKADKAAGGILIDPDLNRNAIKHRDNHEHRYAVEIMLYFINVEY